jgi:hypothetical protein
MSTLSVNTIQPYSGSVLTLIGATVVSASYAATSSFLQGNAASASFATFALTSSITNDAQRALTASYLTTLNQNLTFNGNLILNGTASITYLDVVYQTSSIIYSTGSNQFGDAVNDTQTLYGRVIVPTGSITVTGSVYGNVVPLSISSGTASMNLNSGNFFTLTLSAGASTYINPINIAAGQTTNLVVTTASGSLVQFPSSVKQVSGSSYTPTSAASTDVLTFLSVSTNTLLLSNVKNLV